MKESIYDVIIVGAGPSGLFAAVNLGATGLKVCVLEKMNSAGKKLLISGSSQCNITNADPIENFIEHFGNKKNFVKKSIYNFTPVDLLSFFRKSGIEFTEDRNGKIFPASRKSRDILDVLLLKCRESGVHIVYNSAVTSVENKDSLFNLKSVSGKYGCRYLIICTGGLSFPMTGSSGDGYRLSESLGHSIVMPVPALHSISVYEYFLQDCSGISVPDINVILFRDRKKIAANRDDLLFTHAGLSGPVILNLCRYVRKDDCIRIEIAGVSDQLNEKFKNLILKNGKSDSKNALLNLNLPERLIISLLKHYGINGSEKCAVLKKEIIKKTIEVFSSLEFKIKHADDIKTAMATAGGVSLNEVLSGSMESKKCANLFFSGEVLDIDGDTGGYNLQWAFSSAKTAADSILKKEMQLKIH
ncbi:MAG: NAD(P)/FAD-dependent oxidoreductase [Spirochaetes bacterium]|nr:NAD(P)/FAD-dependent oxidoreductase [Spirochaetota bacterium]